MFSVEVVPVHGGTLVRVTGDLDHATRPQFSAAIKQLNGSVGLDLGGVGFMDSAVVHALIDWSRVQAAHGYPSELSGLHGVALRTFDIAGLGELVTLLD